MEPEVITSAGDGKAQGGILVVVHPGSACGSANFNLGKSEARMAREALVCELDGWSGGVVVIDGGLSDELPDFPELDGALKGCLQRSLESGLFSERVEGDDPGQMRVTAELVMQQGWAASGVHFTVTGAWFHPEDGGGCVGSVVDVLRSMGCEAAVSDCAVALECGEMG